MSIPYKQLIELAIESGRNSEGSQTRYVHYCHSITDEEVHETIPLYENFLFALALMRNKTSEQFQEGKSLLEKLLHFQNPEGNFPVYLHDYPQAKDPLIGLQLLPVFYWMLNSYSHFLGQSLRDQLLTSAKNQLARVQLAAAEIHLPYHLSVKLASIEAGFGALLKDEAMKDKAYQELEELSKINAPFAWFSPELCSELLIGLQIAYQRFDESPWQPLWSFLSQMWNSRTGSYAGPSTKERFQKNEPKLTFLDLYLSYKSEKFPYRFFNDHPVHLQAALIRESEEMLNVPLARWGGVNGEAAFEIRQLPTYSTGVMQKPADLNPSTATYWIGYKMQWGSLNRVRSFVLQGGNFSNLSFTFVEKGIDLTMQLGALVETGDKEKAREIEFFLDLQEGDQYLVKREGKEPLPATTFALSDQVIVKTADLSFVLSFKVAKGQGEMMGHLMRGNRPSQGASKGSERFTAYDQQIFLRTLRRSADCEIKVSIRVE